MPHLQESLEAYLRGRMTGVGTQRARLLVDEFGEDIQEVLRKPREVALERLKGVPGLSARAAEVIKQSWDTNKWRSERSSFLLWLGSILERQQSRIKAGAT